MSTRKIARKWAFQYLYQMQIKESFNIKDDKNIEEFLKYSEEYQRFLKEKPQISLEARKFCFQLIQGTQEHCIKIDELITHNSINWEFKRISHIDLSILRLSLYEGLFLKQTPAIIISEALNIATRFSAPKSTQFINGLLDKIFKSKDAYGTS